METPRCDVIGCTADAQWFLVTEQNGETHEQRLCHRHWRQRMAGRSQRVVRWGHVTAPASPPGAPSRAGAAEPSAEPAAGSGAGPGEPSRKPPDGGPEV